MRGTGNGVQHGREARGVIRVTVKAAEQQEQKAAGLEGPLEQGLGKREN